LAPSSFAAAIISGYISFELVRLPGDGFAQILLGRFDGFLGALVIGSLHRPLPPLQLPRQMPRSSNLFVLVKLHNF
jgi:hypothetical protein